MVATPPPRYEPNHPGWAALAIGPDMVAAVTAVAEEGKKHGESIAPRSTPDERARFDRIFGVDPDRKVYAEAFEVEQTTISVRGRRRAAARLHNRAKHAAAVEWGNEQTPTGRHVFGRIGAFLGGGP